MKLLLSCFLLIVFSQFNKIDAQWYTFANEDSLSNGPHGYPVVFGLLASNGKLYVSGGFVKAGWQNITGIAYWDGNTWHKVGNGVDHHPIETMAMYNNKLYAASTSGMLINGLQGTLGMIRFNGTTWEALPNSYGGLDLTSWVMCMENFNGILQMGGYTEVLNSNMIYNCGYNGIDYVSQGHLFESTHTLKSFNNELYAGGFWYGLMKLSAGFNWDFVGGYTDWYIHDLEVDTFNNFLLCGGGFTYVDDTVTAYNLAIWNGFYWEKYTQNANYSFTDVGKLKLYHGNLYVSMYSDSIEGIKTGYLARWNGNTWHPVGDTIKWMANKLEIFNDTLYVGGYQYYESGLNIGTLGKWYMPPDTSCFYLQPRVYALNDTFYMSGGIAPVQLYNNNAYANSWQWDFGDAGTDNVKDPLHSYTIAGTYTVSVTVTHNTCIKTADKIISILNGTSLEEYTRENLNFRIYPNPTSSNITVELTLPNTNPSELRAFNGFGGLQEKYFLQKGFNKINIPSNMLKNGVSLIGLYVEGKQVLLEKVIKK